MSQHEMFWKPRPKQVMKEFVICFVTSPQGLGKRGRMWEYTVQATTVHHARRKARELHKAALLKEKTDGKK